MLQICIYIVIFIISMQRIGFQRNRIRVEFNLGEITKLRYGGLLEKDILAIRATHDIRGSFRAPGPAKRLFPGESCL